MESHCNLLGCTIVRFPMHVVTHNVGHCSPVCLFQWNLGKQANTHPLGRTLAAEPHSARVPETPDLVSTYTHTNPHQTKHSSAVEHVYN